MGFDEQPLSFVSTDAGPESGGGDEMASIDPAAAGPIVSTAFGR